MIIINWLFIIVYSYYKLVYIELLIYENIVLAIHNSMTTILNKEVFVFKPCQSLISQIFIEESLVIFVNEVSLKNISKKEM